MESLGYKDYTKHTPVPGNRLHLVPHTVHKKTLNEVFAAELSHRQSAMWSFNRGIKLPNKAFGCRFEKCLRQAQKPDSRRTGKDVTAQ